MDNKYKIYIKVDGDIKAEIQSYMPEAIFNGIASEWSSLMPGLSLKSIVGNALNAAGASSSVTGFVEKSMTAVGMAGEPQGTTYQVWGGSSPLEFNLLLLFDAMTNATKDVLEPMLTLERLAAPRNVNGRLGPPGPKLVDLKNNVGSQKNKISIAIGNYIYVSSVVITNVNNTFDSRLDKYGKPISGQSEVTVRTVITPTEADITKFFLLNGRDRYEKFGDPTAEVIALLNKITDNIKDVVSDVNTPTSTDNSSIQT